MFDSDSRDKLLEAYANEVKCVLLYRVCDCRAGIYSHYASVLHSVYHI